MRFLVLHTVPTGLQTLHITDGSVVHATCRHTLQDLLELCRDKNATLLFHGTEVEDYDTAVQALPLDTVGVLDDIYDLNEARKVPMEFDEVFAAEPPAVIADDNVSDLLSTIRWIAAKMLVGPRRDDVFVYTDAVFLFGGAQNATQAWGAYAAYRAIHDHTGPLIGASMGAVGAVLFALYPDDAYERLMSTCESVGDIPLSRAFLDRAFAVLFPDVDASTTLADLFARTGRDVSILTTDVVRWAPRVWNHRTDGDVRVLEVLAASCGIPYVTGFQTIGGRTYCDGDIMSARFLRASSGIRVAFDGCGGIKASTDVLFADVTSNSPLRAVADVVSELFRQITDRGKRLEMVRTIPFGSHRKPKGLLESFGSSAFHSENFNDGYSSLI